MKTKKKKILFLNPPSPDDRLLNRHIIDPHISKGPYLYPPYDFLILSGWFESQKNWTVKIIDSVAMRLNKRGTIEAVLRFQPDFILALTAPQSHDNDMSFLKTLKQEIRVPLFTAGAVQHARRMHFLDKYRWIDGILLEPINNDLIRYLENDDGPFEQLLLGGGNNRQAIQKPSTAFEIPLPRHDLIDSSLYSYPAMVTDRFTTVLTSYSCPYSCAYCEASSFQFRLRSPESVLEELEFINSLEIKEVCFKDWTFAANRKHAEAILDGMIELDLGIKWFTFTRAEVLDRELIRKMKRAGCRILQIGVETVENEVLEKLNRKNSLDRIQEVFTVSREEQILTMATVVLGLPGSSEEGIRKTVDFLIELDPDYASFNIMTPLLGSKLRAQWEELGYIGPEEYDIQDSTRAAFGHLGISPEHLTKIRDEAIRRFYFRPSYLLKRLRHSSSMRQVLNETKTGLSLFLRHILRNSE